MRYPPHLLDEIRARLPVSQVVGRKVALKKKGREFAGLSPFKAEKTASFFVNDQKGFYHCFASGEHGDVFTFLMKTEGLSFPEAVERLAEEAGVALPKPTERDVAVEDERVRLLKVVEAAAQFYEQSLRGAEGLEARRYIERRGLKRDTIARFRLGFAPASKSALKDHLARAGFSVDDMIRSGMLIAGEDIPVPYDRFRNRVMFPICDLKGRVIAFGGRALDADAPAKYLNSPETPLFHKGHVLFNAHTARQAAHDKERIVVVEGYMDVVALAEAGISEAVAPLGTALTEDQVKLLWRMASEPVLCFDGDSAGQKAAYRAVDTALPLLKPGFSMTFAFLPDGLDPDDLVRQQGAEAMEGVLVKARPLVDVLFERELAQGDWSTPERRARLEQQLRQLVARIDDDAVRPHYERDIRRRLGELWGAVEAPRGSTHRIAPDPVAAGRQRPFTGGRPFNPGQGRFAGNKPGQRGVPAFRPAATSSLKRSALVQGEGQPSQREALLIKTLLNHPWLIDDHAEEIARLPFSQPSLGRLRDAILSIQALDNSLDSCSLRTQLSKSGLEKAIDGVLRQITHRGDRFAEPDADRTEVEAGWRHALALHMRQDLRTALDAAEQAWHDEGSEEALARICEIQRQLALAAQADRGDDETASEGRQ